MKKDESVRKEKVEKFKMLKKSMVTKYWLIYMKMTAKMVTNMNIVWNEIMVTKVEKICNRFLTINGNKLEQRLGQKWHHNCCGGD